MNQGFRLRYDEMRDNDPSKTGQAEMRGDEYRYTGISHVRSLCLVWPDGKRMFLNYAYFISANLDVSREQNYIRLNFSTHTVNLTGYRLEELFMSMMEHVPRIVQMVEERYALIDDQAGSIVTNIAVESKENG